MKQISGTLVAVAEYSVELKKEELKKEKSDHKLEFEKSDHESDHKLGMDMLTPDATAENGFKLIFVALPKELTDKTQIESVKIESADENNSSLRIFVTAKNERDRETITEIYECGQTGNAWNCLPPITSKEPVLLALSRDWKKHVRFARPEEAPKALWIGTGGTVEEVEEETSEAKGKKAAGKIHNDDAFNPLKEKAQAIDAWFQPKNAWTVIVGGEQTLKAYETSLDEKNEIQVTALPKEIYTADSTLNNFHNDDIWQCTHFSHPMALLQKDFGGKDLATFCKVVDVKDSKPIGTRLVVFYNINEKPEVKIEPQFDGKTGKVAIEARDIMEDKLACDVHLKDANGVVLDHWIDAASCNEATLTNRGLPPVQDITVNAKPEAQAGKAVTGVAKAASEAKDLAWPVQGEVCAKDPGDAEACQTFQLSKAAVIPAITPAAQTPAGEVVTVAQGGAAEESTPQGYKISGGCSLNKHENNSLKQKLGEIFLVFLSLFVLIKMRLRKGIGMLSLSLIALAMSSAAFAATKCSSEIFDCEKTVSVWAPFDSEVTAATVLNSGDYENQYLVFAGGNKENVALAYKASLDMTLQGDFEFDTCDLDSEPLNHLAAAALNDGAANDLVAASLDKYYVIADFENVVESGEEKCLLHMAPMMDTIVRKETIPFGKASAMKVCNITKIYDIATPSPSAGDADILGAVECASEEPFSSRSIGVDVFKYKSKGIPLVHEYIPVTEIADKTEIKELKILAGSSDADIFPFSLILVTKEKNNLVTSLINCAKENGVWSCPGTQELKEPLLIGMNVDTKRIRAQAEGAQKTSLWITKSGVLLQEKTQGQGRDAGKSVVEKKDRVLTGNGDPDEDFSAAGEDAEAVDAWYEPGAWDFVVTGKTFLKGHRITA